jgi:hypothetical protein
MDNKNQYVEIVVVKVFANIIKGEQRVRNVEVVLYVFMVERNLYVKNVEEAQFVSTVK